MNFTRIALAGLIAALMAACGGGGDGTFAASTSTPAPVPSSPPVVVTSGTVSAAQLVVSAASPSSVNGNLDQTTPATAGQRENFTSNAIGGFSSTGPNDYCTVSTYVMPNSGDSKKYALFVVFNKTSKSVSRVLFYEDVFPRTFEVEASGTVGGTTVDIASRRVGLTNVNLTGTGGKAATLNGALEFITNPVVADQASCG